MCVDISCHIQQSAHEHIGHGLFAEDCRLQQVQNWYCGVPVYALAYVIPVEFLAAGRTEAAGYLQCGHPQSVPRHGHYRASHGR